jgi:hypothetical protein
MIGRFSTLLSLAFGADAMFMNVGRIAARSATATPAARQTRSIVQMPSHRRSAPATSGQILGGGTVLTAAGFGTMMTSAPATQDNKETAATVNAEPKFDSLSHKDLPRIGLD